MGWSAAMRHRDPRAVHRLSGERRTAVPGHARPAMPPKRALLCGSLVVLAGTIVLFSTYFLLTAGPGACQCVPPRGCADRGAAHRVHRKFRPKAPAGLTRAASFWASRLRHRRLRAQAEFGAYGRQGPRDPTGAAAASRRRTCAQQAVAGASGPACRSEVTPARGAVWAKAPRQNDATLRAPRRREGAAA